MNKLQHVQPIQNLPAPLNLDLWGFRKVTLLLQKILRFPLKKPSELFTFFSNAAPKCLLFHGSWWFSSMYLLEPGAANSEPHILSKSHDILSAQHPQQISISHTHTHTQKKMHFCFSKTNFHCWSFWWSNPVNLVKFSEPSTGQPSTRAGSITKKASFYNGFAEQPLYNQIV